MKPSPIVELKKVSHVIDDHGQQTTLLNQVSLTVFAGESLAIVGHSGCGKTTLLNLLAGLDSPTSGQVYIGEKCWQTLSHKQVSQIRRSTFGFIYQHHHLIGELSVLENILLPGWIDQKKPRPELRKRAHGLLVDLSIEHCQHRLPGSLSGGEKQRVAIARALLNQPRCIIADEPTGSLDETSANNTMALLLKLQEKMGVSLVLVTHNIKQAGLMQTVYKLNQGCLTPAVFG